MPLSATDPLKAAYRAKSCRQLDFEPVIGSFRGCSNVRARSRAVDVSLDKMTTHARPSAASARSRLTGLSRRRLRGFVRFERLLEQIEDDAARRG